MGLKFELLKFAHVSFLFDIEHRKKPKLAGPQKCDRSLRGSFEQYVLAGAKNDEDTQPPFPEESGPSSPVFTFIVDRFFAASSSHPFILILP